MLIVYCKSVHYLFAINDGLCQVRDPEKDASVDEHFDQVFHLAIYMVCYYPFLGSHPDQI